MVVAAVTSAHGTRYSEPSDVSPSASAASPTIPPELTFQSYLNAEQTGSPSSSQPVAPSVGLGTLPLGPAFVVPSSYYALPQKTNSAGLGVLEPNSIIPPGGTVSANTAKVQPNQDPDEPPKGSSPAAQAAFYAGRANSYAESAATSNQFAKDLSPQVVAEAAIAGPSYGRTAKQIETALTLARTGVNDAAAGAQAAKVAAFDADTDASAAAAAQEDGNYELAAAEANAAQGAMVAAKGAATSADLGAGKVLYALHSLIPNSPFQLG